MLRNVRPRQATRQGRDGDRRLSMDLGMPTSYRTGHSKSLHRRMSTVAETVEDEPQYGRHLVAASYTSMPISEPRLLAGKVSGIWSHPILG